MLAYYLTVTTRGFICISSVCSVVHVVVLWYGAAELKYGNETVQCSRSVQGVNEEKLLNHVQ